MKPFRFVALFFVLLLTVAWMSPAHADTFMDTIAIYKKSPAVQPFFKNKYGYVVFPTVGKAGFVVGGSYGSGQVYAKGKVTGNRQTGQSDHRFSGRRPGIQPDGFLPGQTRL